MAVNKTSSTSTTAPAEAPEPARDPNSLGVKFQAPSKSESFLYKYIDRRDQQEAKQDTAGKIGDTDVSGQGPVSAESNTSSAPANPANSSAATSTLDSMSALDEHNKDPLAPKAQREEYIG